MKNKILKGIIEEGKPETLYIFPSTKQLLDRASDDELKKLNERRLKIFGKEYDK